VSSNQLSATVPAFGTLAALEFLYLDDNQLSGQLPSFAGLGALFSLDIGGNLFTGRLPHVPSPNHLGSNLSTVCPNRFTLVPDPVNDPPWNAATGDTPWYLPCDEIFFDGFES
jgi:hypothetical protein